MSLKSFERCQEKYGYNYIFNFHVSYNPVKTVKHYHDFEFMSYITFMIIITIYQTLYVPEH